MLIRVFLNNLNSFPQGDYNFLVITTSISFLIYSNPVENYSIYLRNIQKHTNIFISL